MLEGLEAAEDRRDWYDCFERDYSLFPPCDDDEEEPEEE